MADVIEGCFSPRQELEDEAVQAMVAELEAAIDEVVKDGIDHVVIVTVSGDQLNSIRSAGLGATDDFRICGVLQKAAVAKASGA